jgi:hypothetical protein
MFNKILLPFLILLLLPVFANAQEVIEMKAEEDAKVYYLHNGKFFQKDVVDKAEKPKHNDSRKRNIFGDVYLDPNDLADTLSYRNFFSPPPNSNFGFFGQDRMVMWFEAPSDMRIVAAGVMCVAKDDTLTPTSLKLINFAWTMEEMSAITTATQLGWYEAAGNGFNDITAYMDDPDITGGWVDAGGAATSPFGSDLWSDGGVGFPFVPEVDAGATNYNWVPMNLLFEPEVLRGDIVGVSTKNLSTAFDGDRVGWFADGGTGLPLAYKFYMNGRLTPGGPGVGDPGWWARDFTWDYVMAVVLTGDIPPDIESFTRLGTTLSTAARTVDAVITDVDPSGGAPGVASATLHWSIDGGVIWNDVAMTGTEPNFTGEIPGQAAGTEVTYKISATDVGGNTSETLTSVYNVFAKQNEVLFLYNAADLGDATASFFYLGGGTANPVAHDFWNTLADGVAELDNLLALYDAVLEVGGAFPNADLSGNIETWIATGTAGNPKAFIMSSQDYGCFISGCADTTFVPGHFMYDYMGVMSLAPQDFSGGATADMQIMGVASDPVSGWVEDYSSANSVDYWYNPAFEIGGGFNNWIDAVVPTSGATTVFTEPSTGNVVGVRNEGVGWYTSFQAFDYLGCDFLSDTSLAIGDDPGYAWGVTVENQAYAFFAWAGVGVSVELENNLLPAEYKLSQNYPNPFNPSTTIKFSIPEASNVVLKVYDILGSEVAVLVNEEVQAGNYTVDFDASQLASGMYVYTIKAGEFNVSKKMMLLK